LPAKGGKIIGVVGNNVEHFSALWTTTQKIYGVVGNGIIITMRKIKTSL
jgi:hypothetical protein